MHDLIRFVVEPLPGPALSATYHEWLVALSYFVATLAAYTALDLSGRVREFHAEPRKAAAWLAGGALAMGAGIWSMHFVGMLAYQLPVQVRYEAWTTLASMVAAVATSGFALYIVTHGTRSRWRLASGGTVMGAGIGTMHYIGMAGMRLDAVLMYYPAPFALSVVNAIVCSTAALWLMSRRDEADGRSKGIAAAVMGLAIVGMHYTGMWAAVCVAGAGAGGVKGGLDPVLLAVAITLITLLMMGMALVVSQQSQLMSRTLQEQNLLLRNDIAERKKVEELLREAKAVAEAANAAKSQFLATMSHEIRTPMNGVLGMTELLIDSPLSPLQRTWAEAVQASGQHLLSVINDVLDFSKIESGQLELEAVDFDLVDVVEEALAMFAQPAERKGLELAAQFVPHDAPLALCGDPFRLRQVLTNLIGNAIKFTDEGEIVVRVVLERQGPLDASVRVCVQDSGIGIDTDAHARIFEHFSQADGSTTRRFGGTGLGLAICKRMLDLMGGKIRVDSAPGHGSTFSIELCLPRARALAVAPRANTALEGLRVLVVDDNQTNRDILRQQLQGWAMDVTAASGGNEALQLMRRATQDGRPFELAVLDMHMPHMDGLQLAREIQALPGEAAALIMLSSTFANADQAERQQAGILRYLDKPIRRADLFKVLCSVLAGGGAGEANPRPKPARGTPLQLAGHVLLVEDNPINQGVAKAMLRKLGLSTDLALNGVEAVEQVRQQRFDLVLMDCQMPVMDGYEATAIIRRMPGGSAADLPIVALTANAMQGDEQRCLDAGMTAFLAKPYTLPEMQAMLARWLPAAASTPAEAAAPGPAPARTETASAAASPIDPAAIEALRDLDENGGMGLAKELLQAFLETSEQGVNQVAASIESGDDAQLGRAAHTLKSSALNVGARALSACYRELERLGREGHVAASRSLFDQTRLEHQRAVARLREILLELA